MGTLKSFSVGHTAKGAIWWQAWPFDGEARKGTAESIEGALAAIGVTAPAVASVAAVDREQMRKALEAKDAEIARLTAIVARMESLLPDSADPSDNPAPQSTGKAPSRPAKPRETAKAPSGMAPEVAAYLASVRGAK